MFVLLKPLCLAALLSLVVPAVLSAQYPSNVQSELERRAASDPELAAALERLTTMRDSGRYTQKEFEESLRIDWFQYRLSPDAQARLSIEARGSGGIGAMLGSTVAWVDKTSGETQQMSYDARSKFLPDGGLAVDVTIEQDGQSPVTTEYVFENLAPVTVVLREFDDGTRHVARFVPELDIKEMVRDYGRALTMSLSSAALLVDDDYAGEFTVTGEIIGITSSRAGMRFEFGLKPFADATPIGRTDGRTIRFEYQGRRFRLYSTEPITKTAAGGERWNVYVRGEAAPDAFGTGTTVKTYDMVRIQAVMDSLMR